MLLDGWDPRPPVPYVLFASPLTPSGCPAHVAHPDNKVANSITHDSTDRASPPLLGTGTRDALFTYHDITLHCRLSRLTLPPPHRSFPSTTNTRGTNSRPTPFSLLHILPSSTPGCTRRPAA
ncbi:hypothetical protein HPB50_008859 [Hyalomma asiaticum]|uniref:Uncharacterized protein n=1 Tax=Hyalomma asiaticum TaxID=266040 RepID=A0ACB7SU20_HYAAI|nr:hypothetical protein HPB50_008859 [Hyalomma asiaticum]